MTSAAEAQRQKAAPASTTNASSGRKPNILVIWGDDIGIANISAYSNGLMGYETPNIDRIARTVLAFLDRGEVPIVLDDLSTGSREAVPSNVPFVVGDVGDAELVSPLIRNYRLTRSCISPPK